MLGKLYKMAYDLDKRGFHNEAAEIEKVMETMAKRVGLKLEEMVSLANYFDELGETELADTFDTMAKEAAKKKYKEWKGEKGEKPPARHDIKKPPKSWMDEGRVRIKKKNPEYGAKRINEILGDEWYNKMTDKSRDKVWKELGRKGKAEK